MTPARPCRAGEPPEIAWELKRFAETQSAQDLAHGLLCLC